MISVPCRKECLHQAVDASAEGVDGADAVPADAEDVVTETEEGA